MSSTKSDAILAFRRASSVARFLTYGLLYAMPFLVIRDQRLRPLVTLGLPLLVVLCGVAMFWASHRAEALQHELNRALEASV